MACHRRLGHEQASRGLHRGRRARGGKPRASGIEHVLRREIVQDLVGLDVEPRDPHGAALDDAIPVWSRLTLPHELGARGVFHESGGGGERSQAVWREASATWNPGQEDGELGRHRENQEIGTSPISDWRAIRNTWL